MDRVIDKIHNKANTKKLTVEFRCGYMSAHSIILSISYFKLFFIKCWGRVSI